MDHSLHCYHGIHFTKRLWEKVPTTTRHKYFCSFTKPDQFFSEGTETVSFYLIYCAWGTFGEREREIQRERERRKWRHHCRAKIGDEHTFTCQKFAQLAMSLHFPLPKIRTFRFSLHTSRLSLHGEVTIVALKFAMSSHFPLPKFFRPLCSPSFKLVARAARRVIENPRQMIKSCPVLFCSSHWKTESN